MLAAFRFTVVFVLALLLLVPMIKQLKNFIEQPTLAFILDNSQSMESNGLVEQLKQAEEKLINAGYEVEWNSLTKTGIKLEELSFNHKTTDLSTSLKEVDNNHINRNLSKTILLSDGIHNQGFSPEYVQTTAPIYTVGLGDTTTPKDISIQEVYYNKIVYNGNTFPIKVRWKQTGYNNENVNLTIKQNGNKIDSKTMALDKNAVHEATFLIETNAIGKQAYSIEIENKEGESSIQNNTRDIYIQVIDGKERVLIYAAAPHPDVKAIKAALETKENIETVVYYKGFLKQPEGIFDLVITHQFPSKSVKQDPLLNTFRKGETPLWYFVGNNSDIKSLNEDQKGLNVVKRSNSNDKVFGSFNPNFSGFKIESESLKNMQKFPPVDVLFADYQFKGKAEDVLRQQIGSVVSSKPLLTFVEMSNGVKNAYFLGDGLWQWRMAEYAQNENTQGFDELIQKTVRYITAKKDKRQLRVTPIKEEFFTDQSVQFDVEVYNDIYEKIYQKEVKIAVKDENNTTKEFSFVNDESNSRFSIGQLEKGIYTFIATAQVNGKTIRDEGELVIKEQYLEEITTQADFDLLQKIAKNSGGEFFSLGNFNAMVDKLIATEHKPKIVLTDEILKELINQKWIFYLLLILISVEWVIRKYQGDY